MKASSLRFKTLFFRSSRLTLARQKIWNRHGFECNCLPRLGPLLSENQNKGFRWTQIFLSVKPLLTFGWQIIKACQWNVCDFSDFTASSCDETFHWQNFKLHFLRGFLRISWNPCLSVAPKSAPAHYQPRTVINFPQSIRKHAFSTFTQLLCDGEIDTSKRI